MEENKILKDSDDDDDDDDNNYGEGEPCKKNDDREDIEHR